MAAKANTGGDSPGGPRRRYDSPVRRQQAAETRERIVKAGGDLAHELPSWDWAALTFRAVAERAGVGERTVYRYFPTERHLHDAVLEHLQAVAGVSYDGVSLATVASVAERVFASLAAFAAPTVSEPQGSTMSAEDERRRQALREAVAEAAPHWSGAQREAAAAALDVLWGPPSYERMASAWGLGHDRASGVITWMIELVVASIEADEPPPVRRRRPARPKKV